MHLSPAALDAAIRLLDGPPKGGHYVRQIINLPTLSEEGFGGGGSRTAKTRVVSTFGPNSSRLKSARIAQIAVCHREVDFDSLDTENRRSSESDSLMDSSGP
jgi:hypothetical protein